MTNRKKNTILFDLDGTLFDSVPAILKNFQDLFAELETQYPGDEIIKTFLGTDLDNTLRGFISEEKIDPAKSRYRQISFARQNAGLMPLFDDTLATLEHLKKEKYTLGIVTTKMRKLAVPLLEDFNVDQFFDLVIGAEDVKNCKPHPEPLLKAVTDLDREVTEAVYIGDALIDMQAANSAEIDFLAVTTGSTERQAFENNGQDVIVPNLNKILPFLT